ncbi:hypothetical protein [Salibacterium sp. K-3]
MNKIMAVYIAFFSSILLVIGPSITLLSNDIAGSIAVVVQYLLLFSGVIGVIGNAVVIKKHRKGAE